MSKSPSTSTAFMGNFRGQPSGMQIEKNAVWLGEAAGGVLHDVFEVNGDAGGVRG